MGIVLCEKYGQHTGPLCCDHIRQAVYGSQPPMQFGVHRFDVMGDDALIVDHMLCEVCAAQFNLSPDEPICDEAWGDDQKFPNVVPVCDVCFANWTEASAN